MKDAWEPPSADLPEGELEEIAGDELDAMLAERALEALLGDDEDTIASEMSTEADEDGDGGESEDCEAAASDDDECRYDGDE